MGPCLNEGAGLNRVGTHHSKTIISTLPYPTFEDHPLTSSMEERGFRNRGPALTPPHGSVPQDDRPTIASLPGVAGDIERDCRLRESRRAHNGPIVFR